MQVSHGALVHVWSDGALLLKLLTSEALRELNWGAIFVEDNRARIFFFLSRSSQERADGETIDSVRARSRSKAAGLPA